MRFRPRFCPRSDCPAHRSGRPFRCQRAGLYSRRCDRRRVQRFQCLTCQRGFSTQTFRVDYRLKRPGLLLPLLRDRYSKVTHRQSARTLFCSRSTEERHFRRIAEHCRELHDSRLAEVAARGGLGRSFLLDELETYEHHRTKKPVTVPVLIERKSGFVLDLKVGSMVARGKRRPGAARRSESRQRVREAFRLLWDFAPKDRVIGVTTDVKPTYAAILRRLFGKRCFHIQITAKRLRDGRNPLSPVNHTCARLRDGVSSLVRETWAASKKRRGLRERLAIWICYRNYIRGRINREPRRTPAMALGVTRDQYTPRRLLAWRVFPGR